MSINNTVGPLLFAANEIESEMFIENLSRCNSLKDQIKHIQLFRGQFLRGIIASSNAADAIISARLLMWLYLHPDYALLRKSVEWIIEVVCTNRSINQRALKEALCDVSLNLIFTAEALGIFRDMNVETATRWALSFTCIAMFDKEYYFLDGFADSSVENKKILQLDDTSPLLKFLSVLGKMFAKFSKIVSAKETDSSAEVMRYAECCGECMRAIMTSLKSRREAYVGKGASEEWMALINSVIANGCEILQSDLVHKDTVTATAMSVVCLQWIARYQLRGDESIPAGYITSSTQLLSILHLMDLSSSSEGEASPFREMALSGVHTDLAANLPTLPIISRCAILRACLTVFDDFTLSLESPFDVSGVSSGVNTSAGSRSILLGPLFSAVVTVCSHSLPLVRLYGLQTLESWFNCLDVIVSPLSLVDSLTAAPQVDSLMPHLRTVSSLLINTWSHPSKQVNHMVPTVYQRLINAAHALTVGLRKAGRGTEVTSIWKPFIAEALALPAQHRARYQAMTMLIPCVGGKQIIALQPDVFESLVQAVRLRDVASSSCTVVVALLKDLIQHHEPHLADDVTTNAGNLMEPLRPLWALSVATVVCSRDLKTRTNSADYLVPELLKIDPSSGPYLMEMIRSIHSADTRSNEDGSFGAMLWGLVQVTLHARSLTLPGKDIIILSDLLGNHEGKGAMLTDEEVTWACLSEDDDLRLASLTLLTGQPISIMPSSNLSTCHFCEYIRISYYSFCVICFYLNRPQHRSAHQHQ